MNLEQKVENLEGELGLMKGEIKKTLVDLRDFVLKQGSPFSGGGEGGGGGLSEAMFQNMLEEAKASIRLEAVDGGGGGVSPDEVRLMVEDAMASRPSDGGGGIEVDEMRQEMEELRRENQRAIDAVKAEASSSGGGVSREELEAIKAEVQSAAGSSAGAGISRAELEALRTEQATQASATQRQLAAMQTEQVAQTRTIQQQAAAPIPQVIQAPAQAEVVQAGQVQQPQAQTPGSAPAQASQPELVETIEIEVPEEGQAKKPPPQVIQIKAPPPKGAPEPEPAMAEPALLSQPETAEEAWQFVEETGEVYQAPAAGVVSQPQYVPETEEVPEANALDANLLTSLMRWVGGVKRRLGSNQLEGFLEIYKLTGHLPPVVERLIYYLAELDALPDESSDQVFTLDDLMDSLLHLHAIVYGPGHAAKVSLPIFEEQFEENVVEDG